MPCFCCSRIGFLRIVSNYSQGTGLEFLEEEIHNKFLMATKVSENSDRGLFGKKINRFGVSKMALMVHVYHVLFAGCPVDSDDTVITYSRTWYIPFHCKAWRCMPQHWVLIYLLYICSTVFVTWFVLILQLSELNYVRMLCPMMQLKGSLPSEKIGSRIYTQPQESQAVVHPCAIYMIIYSGLEL